MKRRIYLASSWRNRYQPELVEYLRDEGHQVYDFRNPGPGDTGFHWASIDYNWQTWDAERFRDALDHPIALDGYSKDLNAMRWADTFVLLLPCGRSAHLELGWAIGAGKPSAIYLEDGEPELMYLLADQLVVGPGELAEWLESL